MCNLKLVGHDTRVIDVAKEGPKGHESFPELVQEEWNKMSAADDETTSQGKGDRRGCGRIRYGDCCNAGAGAMVKPVCYEFFVVGTHHERGGTA